MKLVIALDGIDACGKSTIIEMFKQKYSDFVYTASLPTEGEFSQIKDFSWWFNRSNADEFCDLLSKAFAVRANSLGIISSPIILLDKGFQTVKARAISTLRVKGMCELAAEQLFQRKFITQYVEHASLLIVRSDDIEQRKSLNMKIENLSSASKDLYLSYSKLQKRYIEKYCENAIIIDNSNHISETISKIEEAIDSIVRSMFKLNPKKQILAIGGLTESGKSLFGKYICERHNILNLKFRYFNSQILEKYLPGESNEKIVLDNPIYKYLLYYEIYLFFTKMDYVEIISLESIHYSKLILSLKSLLQDQLLIIYIESDYSIRLKRLNPSNSATRQDISRKDAVKVNRGSNEVKLISDCLIENNSNLFFNYYDKIDKIVMERKVFEKTLVASTNKQSSILNQIFDDIKTCFRSNLKLLMVTGSYARNITQWDQSDIDLIIIIEHFSIKSITALTQIFSNYSIHIGLTYLTRNEMVRKLFDLKTLYAFYKLNIGDFNVLYCDKKITIPSVSLFEVSLKATYDIGNQLHSWRRLVLNPNEHIAIFKKTSHLLRTLLLIEMIDSSGYSDVFTKATKYFDFPIFETELFLKTKEKSLILTYVHNVMNKIN